MLTQVPKFFFGANLKVLKQRIKSVSSIKKITKAMKMVSASKMKIEVSRMMAGRNFGKGSVQRMLEDESYLQKKKPTLAIKKTLIVPFTSDKGLCGGVNSSIVREIKHTINQNREAFKIFTIGEKSTVALVRPFPDLLQYSINQVASPINFPTACSVAHNILAAGADCDNVIIVFNEFKNAISQTVKKTEIMSRTFFVKHFKYVTRHEATEPEKDWAQNYFYELYAGSIFYNAFLNSVACEQSARMNAMENASKNASEMVEKLTLAYNKARQAKITMELVEIISGANAL